MVHGHNNNMNTLTNQQFMQQGGKVNSSPPPKTLSNDQFMKLGGQVVPQHEPVQVHQSFMDKVKSAVVDPLKTGVDNAKSYVGNVVDTVKTNAQDLGNTVKKANSEGNLVNVNQTSYGEAAHGANDLFNILFSPVTGALSPVIQKSADALSNNSSFQHLANSPVGDVTAKVQQNVQDWLKAHPNSSETGQLLLNLASLIKGPEAAGGVVNAADKGVGALADAGRTSATVVDTGLRKVGDLATQGSEKLNQVIDNKATADQWDVLKPKLTPTEIADRQLKNPETFQKSALGQTTISPNKGELAQIESTKGLISSSKTPTENIQAVKNGISQEATNLREGLQNTGATYTKSQVQGALNKIEPSTMITADSTLNKAYALVKSKMVSLSGQGGSLDKLINARTAFDSFVEKQFPNLYTSDTLTPMKSVITDIRQGVNDLIKSRLPEGNLPDGTNFAASLDKQTNMYRAMDSIASKTPKLDQTVLQRAASAISAHPILSSVAGVEGVAHADAIVSALTNPVALTALATYGVYRGAKAVLTSDMFLKGMSDFLAKAGDTLNPADKSAIQSVIETIGKQNVGLSIQDVSNKAKEGQMGDTLNRLKLQRQKLLDSGLSETSNQVNI